MGVDGPVVSNILGKLSGVKSTASGWMACCPAHEDGHQSLQISERPDQSAGLWCHAGCSTPDVLAALGITFADLFAAEAPPAIIATYNYRDISGDLLYQAVRYSPKAFKQRRPSTDGSSWVWNMALLKGKLVAYRLNDLKGHTAVVVVEGEKDADLLWKAGVPATTNVGGAKKWTSSVTESLKQAGVLRAVVIPDNDEAGKEHAAMVQVQLTTNGITAHVQALSDVPTHGDVSDWLAGPGTAETIQGWLTGPPETHGEAIGGPTVPSDALTLTKYHTTDLGVAESLRDRYGDQLRYDHQRKQWLTWDGHFWHPDMDDAAFRLANKHVRLLQRDALLVVDYQARKRYTDWALMRERRGPMVAMMSQASALLPIAIAGDTWDADGWVLGTKNGIVDLRSGILRKGTREDFVTLQSGTSFDPAAKCPRWEQFLREVFKEDEDLIHYIHKAVGYSLTTDMREQCFFVAYGPGGNGKSIFIGALESVFGTYAHRADMRLFAGHGDQSNSFQNADFRGKRIILAAEPRPNSRMNEHVLKHFTGGETLRAEHKYGRSFTVRPAGKIWLGVNHRPRVADDSFGFWRRVRLIPFVQTFAGDMADLSLAKKLREERSGILAWAVRGCTAWQKEGLSPPEIVQQSTEEYQQDEDVLADFFDTRIQVNEKTVEELTSYAKIYMAYRDWASDQGISDREKLSSRAFASMLQSRHFKRVKHGNSICYKGLRILSGRFDGM